MVHPPPFSLVATFVRPVSFGVFIRRVSRAHLEARANATLAAICHLRVLSFPRWEILIYRIIWPEAKYMCIWLYLKRVLGYRPRMPSTCKLPIPLFTLPLSNSAPELRGQHAACGMRPAAQGLTKSKVLVLAVRPPVRGWLQPQRSALGHAAEAPRGGRVLNCLRSGLCSHDS
eukprot:scaffold208650_cov27-Tisochrysis_lutea.AAC.2